MDDRIKVRCIHAEEKAKTYIFRTRPLWNHCRKSVRKDVRDLFLTRESAIEAAIKIQENDIEHARETIFNAEFHIKVLIEWLRSREE